MNLSRGIAFCALLSIALFSGGCAASLADMAHYANTQGDYNSLVGLLAVEANPNESAERKAQAVNFLENLSPSGKKLLIRAINQHPDRYIQGFGIRHLASYKDESDAKVIAKFLLKNADKQVLFDNPDPLIEACRALAIYKAAEKFDYVADIYDNAKEPELRALLLTALANLPEEKHKEANAFLIEKAGEGKKYPKIEAAAFNTLYPEYETAVPTLRRAGQRIGFIVDAMVYGTKNLQDADLALEAHTSYLVKLAKEGHLSSDTGKQSAEILYKGFLRLPMDYRTYTKPLREIGRNLEECIKILGIELSSDIVVDDGKSKPKGFLD